MNTTEPQLQRIALGAVLSQSFRLLKGSKSAILLASALLMVLTLVATLITAIFFPGIMSGSPSQLDSLAAALVSLLVTSPLLGGLIWMALTRARGEPIEVGMIRRGTPYATRFLSYGLVTGLLSFLMGILPGTIYQLLGLGVAALISFTPHFMVDRDLQLPEALVLSARLVLLNPLAMLGWLMLAVLLLVASFFTLGIGLIWTLPFVAVSSAMFYLHANNNPAP